jgi:hypothetical protein
MKSSFKMPLLAAAPFALLFIVHITSCTSSGNQTDSAASPNGITPVRLAITRLNDTSGNQPILHVAQFIPSGSQFVVTCGAKNCVPSASDTSGNPGGPKVLFAGTLNMDIPENTDIILKIVSKDEPVNAPQTQK